MKKIEVNKVSDSIKKSLVTRIITSIAIVLLFVPAVIIGDWFFAIIMLLLSFITNYEFINVLASKKFPLIIDIFVFIMSTIFTYWVWGKQYFTDGIISSHGHIVLNDIGVSTLALATMMLILFMFALMYSRFDVTDVCYLISMSLLVSLGFQAFYFLRFAPMSSISGGYEYNGNHYLSCLLFFYVAIGSFMSDIGAYFIGILFGKHKMNPRISPKKTWEGFVGGIVFSFVCSFTYAILLDVNGIPLIKGILDLEHWYFVLFISLAMPFVSVLGDLLFSTIKRYYNRKDFSNVLPGHGGILDRIDSLLVTSLVVTLLILAIDFYGGLLG